MSAVPGLMPTPVELEVLRGLAPLHAASLARHLKNSYMPPLVPTDVLVREFEGRYSQTAVKKALTSLRKMGLLCTHKNYSGWGVSDEGQAVLASVNSGSGEANGASVRNQ